MDRMDELAVSLASESPVSRRGIMRRLLFGAAGAAAGVAVLERPAWAGPTKGVTCPPGLVACGSVCRDVAINPDNCGACGTVCGPGLVCRNGACVASNCTCAPTCPTGMVWCTGACVDETTDVHNCGACGHVCPGFANGVAACTSGVCGGTCNAGFADCNHTLTDGCETNILSDLNNCGACGHVCPSFPNGTATCTSGVCGGTCNAGFGDCDGNPANGCETNLTNSLNNCGTCGNVCAGANASYACVGSSCQIVGCSAGFANCNNNPADGCETNVTSDVNNCGGCGMVCNGANATMTCSGGQCVVGACSPGFADCDHNPANGCETNLNTSINNCGACGNVCAAPNASFACANGACQLVSCAPGFADCNRNPADGCEVNLDTDRNNCGACGNRCLTSQVCSSGVCV